MLAMTKPGEVSLRGGGATSLAFDSGKEEDGPRQGSISGLDVVDLDRSSWPPRFAAGCSL